MAADASVQKGPQQQTRVPLRTRAEPAAGARSGPPSVGGTSPPPAAARSARATRPQRHKCGRRCARHRVWAVAWSGEGWSPNPGPRGPPARPRTRGTGHKHTLRGLGHSVKLCCERLTGWWALPRGCGRAGVSDRCRQEGDPRPCRPPTCATDGAATRAGGGRRRRRRRRGLFLRRFLQHHEARIRDVTPVAGMAWEAMWSIICDGAGPCTLTAQMVAVATVRLPRGCL